MPTAFAGVIIYRWMEKSDVLYRVGALTQLGMDLYDRGRYADGLAAFEEALALAPDYVRAVRGKALCLAQLGRAEEARSFAERAVALSPAEGIVYATLGLCLHRCGRPAEAVAAFEKGITLAPDDYRVYYNYACYWAERGNEDECRRYLALAFDLAPSSFADKPPSDPDLARYVGTGWFRDLIADLKCRAFRTRGT